MEPLKRSRRRRGVVARIGAAFLLLVLCGVIYEEAGRRSDRGRLPRIGRAVDVGARTLNIQCYGNGPISVVFDAVANASGYYWNDIALRAGDFSRACWFDRAGEGWSDRSRFPQRSADVARDLHALLEHGSVPPPYVLVGASLGGLNARVYTGLYPSEVAGLVLVDAAHEDEPRRAPESMRGRTAPPALWSSIYFVAQAADRVGLFRLFRRGDTLAEDPARRTREQIVEALQIQSMAVSIGNATGPESYEQARAAGTLGDRPLVVLTRGRLPGSTGDSTLDRERLEYERIWAGELQAQLARLSRRGRQVIVERSGHHIAVEAPNVVLDAIRRVVTDVEALR